MITVGFCLGTFGSTYTQLREAAQQLDVLGFDSVWVWDHYVSWNDPYEPVLEGWTTLAALAEVTTHVTLGTLVANITNRHPGRLAKVAATLHEISGGRCELGIGAGGLEYEQVQFGIDQGSPRKRVECVYEALQIIPALWTGELVTFQGNHYQLTEAISSPRQAPPPHLIVGASGPRMVQLAGRYADGLNLQWRDRQHFPSLFEALDKGLIERGRSREGFDLSIHPMWPDFIRNPKALLEQWQQIGFTRALVYVGAPFPLSDFEKLAQQLDL